MNKPPLNGSKHTVSRPKAFRGNLWRLVCAFFDHRWESFRPRRDRIFVPATHPIDGMVSRCQRCEAVVDLRAPLRVKDILAR